VECQRVSIIMLMSRVMMIFLTDRLSSSAGIFKQSTGPRNREREGMSYPARQATQPGGNWFLGIDSWAP
jgi:hypothetical protein